MNQNKKRKIRSRRRNFSGQILKNVYGIFARKNEHNFKHLVPCVGFLGTNFKVRQKEDEEERRLELISIM